MGAADRGSNAGPQGLGLSVVRAIATAHGGQLRYLRSCRGGSIFEMAIPLDRPGPVTAPPVEQPS